MTAPTLLYLHGFASGPLSLKGVAFERALQPSGIRVLRLDLRVPDRDRLRLSAMVALTERALETEQAVAIAGSSLGGLVAAIVATAAPRLRAAILLAPAVGFAARWSDRLGPEAMRRWRQGEPLSVEDHTGGPPLEVDYGFYEDAVRTEQDWRRRCDREGESIVPTLVVQGSRDEVLDPAGARAHAARLPHGRLLEVEDGHELHAATPTIIDEALRLLRGRGVGQG